MYCFQKFGLSEEKIPAKKEKNVEIGFLVTGETLTREAELIRRNPAKGKAFSIDPHLLDMKGDSSKSTTGVDVPIKDTMGSSAASFSV